jgi:hypothetical protein
MSKNRFVAVSVFVVVLMASSFFIGTLYSPYERVGVYSGFESEPSGNPLIDKTLIATATQAPRGTEIPQERMVIYNAYVSLETSDIQGNLVKIRSLAEGYGGYVAGSARSEDWAEITIRVPKEKFRAAVEQIEIYGKVVDERTSSEDVTEQYIDLKARLQNLERQEKRLHEILEMAKAVDELLNVERELERVRGEIESLQGQINYLERNVAMSVITIHLSEPPPPFTPPCMDWKETFETALRGLFIVIRGLIITVISLLPLTVIGVPAYYLYRRRSRRQSSK